ncbi:hypothetical protein [Mycobacteroides abscessus]|nr:hypothetical protein [Mycobacteroides abscessus]
MTFGQLTSQQKTGFITDDLFIKDIQCPACGGRPRAAFMNR